MCNVGAALKKNPALRYIQLDKNKIGDAGAKAIAEGLSGNKVLNHLNISHNKIGDAGAEAIGMYIANNRILTDLYLDHNNIGDDGVKVIRDVRANNKLLKWVSLNNQIVDDSPKAVKENEPRIEAVIPVINKTANSLEAFLGAPETFSMLDLAGQNITDVDCIKLGAALKKSPDLKYIYLDKNKIGDVGIKAIVEGLSNNKVIDTISLEHNQIGDAGAKVIREGFSNNEVFAKIYLTNQRVDDDVNYISPKAYGEEARENEAAHTKKEKLMAYVNELRIVFGLNNTQVDIAKPEAEEKEAYGLNSLGLLGNLSFGECDEGKEAEVEVGLGLAGAIIGLDYA